MDARAEQGMDARVEQGMDARTEQGADNPQQQQAGQPPAGDALVISVWESLVTKKTHVHWKQRRLGAFANSTPASELHDHPSIHPFITDCSIYVQMQALCACACTWARAHMPVHALLSKRPPAAHAWEARTTWPARRAALPLAWHAEECERVNAHSLEYVPAGRGPCG